MTIKGVVEEIIFYNQENGYAVLIIDVDGEPVTLTGSFVNVQEGVSIEASGEFIENAKFGTQFKAVSIILSQPTTLFSIAKFLSSGLVKGVGEVTAGLIVDTFKEDTLNVIEKTPQLLTNIRGVSPKKASDIANSYMEVKAMQQAVMFLQGYEITTNMAVKIYNKYKQNTQSIVAQSPYQLVEDIDGIGFLTADIIARKVGVNGNDVGRIRAGVIHILKNSVLEKGSTYLFKAQLYEKIQSLLDIELEQNMARIDTVMVSLELSGIIVAFEQEGRQAIAFKQYFDYEKEISSLLLEYKVNSSNMHIDIDADIAEYERTQNIVLHDSQREAVRGAINEGIFVITGGPGTGKTTIINLIVSLLSKHKYKVSLVAPTGRASKRLALATGCEAKTIHRYLGYDFVDGVPTFSYNRYNKVDTDVIIIDEMSMVDTFLMQSLIIALPKRAKIIMVGDKDQLPSVGAGNVLKDIIDSKKFEVCFLSYIYRQSENSLISENAHLINTGNMPKFDNASGDFFFSSKSISEEILTETLTLFTQRIPKFKGVSMEDIQVLAPIKKGACGTLNLNARLQSVINPPSSVKNEVVISEQCFREGDRVIHTVNNYQLEWKEPLDFGGENSGRGVFNGDIGYITMIDKKGGFAEVQFEDGKRARYTNNEMKQLMLAYAISVHKSQGSEFDVVILPLTKGYKDLYTRNLLYTAITRAKKMLVIVGERSTIAYMVQNNFCEKRYSLLGEFLKGD